MAGETARSLWFRNEPTKRVIFHGGFLFIIDLFFATQLGFEDYIKTHVGKRGIFGSSLLETTSPQKMLRGGLK